MFLLKWDIALTICCCILVQVLEAEQSRCEINVNIWLGPRERSEPNRSFRALQCHSNIFSKLYFSVCYVGEYVTSWLKILRIYNKFDTYMRQKFIFIFWSVRCKVTCNDETRIFILQLSLHRLERTYKLPFPLFISST